MPPDLDVIVLEIVRKHVGYESRISRRALVENAFDVDLTGVNLANNSYDRYVRESLVKLQENYPILSTSGGGGYYYAGSADEINRYAAELNSRANKLLKKSRILLKLAKKYKREIQLPLVRAS